MSSGFSVKLRMKGTEKGRKDGKRKRVKGSSRPVILGRRDRMKYIR